MELTNLKNKLLQNPKFRKVFFGHDLAYDTAKMLIEARIQRGVTQAKLAKMMKTKQAGISRAENGTYLPSLSFIQKMANAYGTFVIAPRFGFLIQQEIQFKCLTSYTHLEKYEASATSPRVYVNPISNSYEQHPHRYLFATEGR